MLLRAPVFPLLLTTACLGQVPYTTVVWEPGGCARKETLLLDARYWWTYRDCLNVGGEPAQLAYIQTDDGLCVHFSTVIGSTYPAEEDPFFLRDPGEPELEDCGFQLPAACDEMDPNWSLPDCG